MYRGERPSGGETYGTKDQRLKTRQEKHSGETTCGRKTGMDKDCRGKELTKNTTDEPPVRKIT